MNFQEILSELKAQGYNSGDDIAEGLPKSMETLGQVKCIEDVGGEGEGDHRHVVYHFEDHDIFIRLDGYYASYDGTTWDNIDQLYEVFPKQKVVTVYERQQW